MVASLETAAKSGVLYENGIFRVARGDSDLGVSGLRVSGKKITYKLRVFTEDLENGELSHQIVATIGRRWNFGDANYKDLKSQLDECVPEESIVIDWIDCQKNYLSEVCKKIESAARKFLENSVKTFSFEG